MSANNPPKRKKPPTSADSLAKVPKTAPGFLEPNKLVTFLIGRKKVKFSVHKENVCEFSPALTAAFNGPFIEGQTQTYTLENVKPDVFRMVLNYFYRQKLDLPIHQSLEERLKRFNDDEILMGTEDKNLLGLWILADKLIMPELQNLVIDQLVMARNFEAASIPTFDFKYIYNNTMSGSQLRKLYVHACYDMNPETLLEYPGEYPNEFLLEFAHFMLEVRFKDAQMPEGKLVANNYYVPVEKS